MTIDANTFQDRIEAMYPPMPAEGDPQSFHTMMGLAQYVIAVAFDTQNIANHAYLTEEEFNTHRMVANAGEMLMGVSRICTLLGISLDEVMHRKLHKPITDVSLLERLKGNDNR